MILMHRQRHDDFFQRRIPGTFTDSIDSALDDVDPFLNAGKRVGNGQSQIIMKVDSQQARSRLDTPS